MRILSILCLAAAAAVAQPRSSSVHYIEPGQDPQAVHDAASPGDRLVFLPGLHEHPLRKHQSILYVDKSIDVELMAGAVLRLADGQTTLETDAPELTIDHGAPKRLDDFRSGGRYDGSVGQTFFVVRIDGEDAEGRPDTFEWGVGDFHNPTHHRVPVTGDWQTLDHGVQVRFDSTVGHNVGSTWVLSYDGRESYGIRVGRGTQPDYVENVRIFGRGTIDMNHAGNVQPTGWVKNISACVLLHGRVRNVSVEQITMTNTMRSVMAYGEHTGRFLPGGATEGGESFDAEKISIVGTRTINPVDKGYLLGHPSHRGRLTNVRCNYNYMETGTTALEPNFNLSQYEVIGNVIKSGGRAVHCWRKSSDGVIKNNVRIDDTTGLEVVMVNSPGAWEDPENLVIRDNVNHLSDSVGRWASVTAGRDNAALGDYSAVTGGRDNRAEAPYSRAHGLGAVASRPGEDALASGFFDSPGDAQASRLVARATTTDDRPTRLLLGDGRSVTIPKNAAVAYRILVVARGPDGEEAGFEVSGVGLRASVRELGEQASGLGFRVSEQDGELVLEAVGLAGQVWRWAAGIELVRVGAR